MPAARPAGWPVNPAGAPALDGANAWITPAVLAIDRAGTKARLSFATRKKYPRADEIIDLWIHYNAPNGPGVVPVTDRLLAITGPQFWLAEDVLRLALGKFALGDLITPADDLTWVVDNVVDAQLPANRRARLEKLRDRIASSTTRASAMITSMAAYEYIVRAIKGNYGISGCTAKSPLLIQTEIATTQGNIYPQRLKTSLGIHSKALVDAVNGCGAAPFDTYFFRATADIDMSFQIYDFDRYPLNRRKFWYFTLAITNNVAENINKIFRIVYAARNLYAHGGDPAETWDRQQRVYSPSGDGDSNFQPEAFIDTDFEAVSSWTGMRANGHNAVGAGTQREYLVNNGFDRGVEVAHSGPLTALTGQPKSEFPWANPTDTLNRLAKMVIPVNIPHPAAGAPRPASCQDWMGAVEDRDVHNMLAMSRFLSVVMCSSFEK